MLRGTLRAGSTASSALVAITSKPTKQKKTVAAPLKMPEKPKGAKGTKLAARAWPRPAQMTIRLRMAILFVVALLTAVALVVVSHWAISRAFEASERFVERDLARSQARAGIRESLDRIRRAQDRIGRGTE